MAEFIQTTLDRIDDAIEGYAETVFTDFADPITTTIQLAGVVSLAFVALNTMVQWVPIRVTEYTKWGLRYVIVLAVATSWQQFLPFYDILTNTPGAIGAALLGATDAPNLNMALDDMVARIFEWSDHASAQSGWLGISLTAVLLMVLGALMACVAILVSAIAKIGLAMAVSLAPFFIGTLLFRATSDLFTHWTRFTIGFALIPLVLAGVMGAVIGVGQELMEDTRNQPTTMSEIAGFLIITMSAIIMMSQVPTMVNGLAGTIVATTSGIREAQRIGGATARVARAAGREAHYQGMKARSAAGAGLAAYRSGDEGYQPMQAMLRDAARHREARKTNMARYEDRQARFGGRVAGWGEKREAGRAGGLQSMRQAIAERKAGNKPNEGGQNAGGDTVVRRNYDPAALKRMQERIAADKAKAAETSGSEPKDPDPKKDS